MKYGINREAVKTSAWSLGKIDKFEYLTSKEILPSYQRKVIEQTKFAYSPLGKVFEKKKTIEDQGEKQIESTEDNQKQLENNELLFSKEREIFKNIYNKTLGKIDELSKKLTMATWNLLLIVAV